jgi:hypothetical protein
MHSPGRVVGSGIRSFGTNTGNQSMKRGLYRVREGAIQIDGLDWVQEMQKLGAVGE